MPELPEVETTLRGIQPYILGQRITDVIVRQSQLRWPVPRHFKQKLMGQTVTQLMRRGKYLLVNVDVGTIIIHLGMSGSLRVLTQSIPAQKHEHVDIVFTNQVTLRYKDPRRFGAMLWTKEDPEQHSLIKHLGLEPLSTLFSGRYLWQAAQAKRVPVKTFIMNNKIVTGVGNIYATEALFFAGLHPATSVNQISLECMNRLAKAIKTILRQAIQQGGTTLKDFVNGNGKPGYFSNQLKVYGRAGLSCIQCSLLLQPLRIGQRSTVFCKHCQN